jgi:hypothetical protein
MFACSLSTCQWQTCLLAAFLPANGRHVCLQPFYLPMADMFACSLSTCQWQTCLLAAFLPANGRHVCLQPFYLPMADMFACSLSTCQWQPCLLAAFLPANGRHVCLQPFYLPMAFFVPPSHAIIHKELNLLYQASHPRIQIKEYESKAKCRLRECYYQIFTHVVQLVQFQILTEMNYFGNILRRRQFCHSFFDLLL